MVMPSPVNPEEFDRVSREEALERFGKSVNPDSVEKINEVRQLFFDMSLRLRKIMPMGRYASLAMTSLEESAMWTNKAIVHFDQKIIK
jgi:hypothetical protein